MESIASCASGGVVVADDPKIVRMTDALWADLSQSGIDRK
jgi:hypothetical protein